MSGVLDSFNMLKFLLLVLTLIGGNFFYRLIVDYFKHKREKNIESEGSLVAFGIIGVIVNFFDTLGIGSFATTTALFKQYKLVKDKSLPETLNVALCIPIVAQALIFMDSIEVDQVTLIFMIASACAGALIGAKYVVGFSEKLIQRIMSFALLVVVIIILAGKFGVLPSGGTATGLTGVKLLFGIVGNFILGVLMTMGVGLYAPCMALVYALGMDPKAAFPIMMGSCAFLMPLASLKFIKEGAYNKRGSLLMTITGIFGVLVAAYIVKSLDVAMLLWGVTAVIFYTSIKLYKDSKK